ncbi:hypothetical protein BJX65DRAFT_315107 [Aspergillus insuetus]
MRILYESRVRELMEHARGLKADTEDPLYTRHLISLLEKSSTGEERAIRLVDDIIIRNLIQVGDLLSDVIRRLESEAKAHSADPMWLGLHFSTFSDRQHSATNMPQSHLLSAGNNKTPHGPDAEGTIGATPNQAQYRQHPPSTMGKIPSHLRGPEAAKMAEAALYQPLQRPQAFDMRFAAPIQLPPLQALDMDLVARNQALPIPRAPEMAGAGPNRPPYVYPVSKTANSAPNQPVHIPRASDITLGVPVQSWNGPQPFDMAKATPVTINHGHGQLQSSNLGKSTQIIDQKRERPPSTNSVNIAQYGNWTRGKPHSVSPAQVTYQDQGELRSSDMLNAVSIKDFAYKQTPVRLQPCSTMRTDVFDQQGRSQLSTKANAAPTIDLTDENTPNGPKSQAPNRNPHQTQIAGKARILNDDPLDTEPNTPIFTSDAALEEHELPGRSVREDLSQGRAMVIHAGQADLTPDTAVVNEAVGRALQVDVQLQDTPRASKTRKRKRAGTEDTMPAARSRRPVRGR